MQQSGQILVFLLAGIALLSFFGGIGVFLWVQSKISAVESVKSGFEARAQTIDAEIQVLKAADAALSQRITDAEGRAIAATNDALLRAGKAEADANAAKLKTDGVSESLSTLSAKWAQRVKQEGKAKARAEAEPAQQTPEEAIAEQIQMALANQNGSAPAPNRGRRILRKV